MIDHSSSRGVAAGVTAGCISRFLRVRPAVAAAIMTLVCLVRPDAAQAQTTEDARVVAAGAVLHEIMQDSNESIPEDLLRRAHGIAIFPGVVRGGFIFGARRGRGVLVVRAADGSWSNPAFITLTSGSIGWQAGAQSADVILVFANERAVANIASGRFTLGGDASVVAGPVGRHATAAATFRAEVYAYQRSRGLFAGASFEGVRLGVDREAARRYYGTGNEGRALAARGAATPDTAALFLRTLESAEGTSGTRRAADAGSASPAVPSGAIVYPLDD